MPPTTIQVTTMSKTQLQVAVDPGLGPNVVDWSLWRLRQRIKRADGVHRAELELLELEYMNGAVAILWDSGEMKSVLVYDRTAKKKG